MNSTKKFQVKKYSWEEGFIQYFMQLKNRRDADLLGWLIFLARCLAWVNRKYLRKLYLRKILQFCRFVFVMIARPNSDQMTILTISSYLSLINALQSITPLPPPHHDILPQHFLAASSNRTGKAIGQHLSCYVEFSLKSERAESINIKSSFCHFRQVQNFAP